MRKFMYGAFALGAALAVGFGVNAGNASAGANYEISLNETGSTLYIGGGEDKIMVAATSVSKDKVDGAASVKMPTAWDVYDSGALVDLSKYSEKKDNFFLVKKDTDTDDKAVLVLVPKSPTLQKLVWEKDGKFTANDGTTKAAIIPTGGALKIAGTEDGYMGVRGDKFELPDWERYAYMGATLNLAQVPVEQCDAETAFWENRGSNVAKYKVGSNTFKTFLRTKGDKDSAFRADEIYVTGSRNGVPAKLTVPKWAAAPKVTADYVNGKITVAKGAEVTFSTTNENVSEGAVKVYDMDGTTDKTEAAKDTGTAGASYWLNKPSKAQKGTNYLLDPEATGTVFYADVVGKLTGAKDKFSTTRAGRAVFPAQVSTTNTGTAIKATDAVKQTVPVAIGLTYKKTYTITFSNATTDKYTIAITDGYNTKKPSSSVNLGAGTWDKTAGKVKKAAVAKYATTFKDESELEEALKGGSGDKTFSISITRAGNKTTSQWPGATVKYAAMGKNATTPSEKPGFDQNFVLDDLTGAIAANHSDYYEVSLLDGLKVNEGKKAGTALTAKTVSDGSITADVVTGTKDKFYYIDKFSKDQLVAKKTVDNKEEPLDLTNVMNKKDAIGCWFKMPAGTVKIEKKSFKVTATGATIYDAKENGNAITSGSDVKVGTTIWIELENGKIFKEAIGDKDGNRYKLEVTKEIKIETVNGYKVEFASGSSGTILAGESGSDEYKAGELLASGSKVRVKVAKSKKVTAAGTEATVSEAAADGNDNVYTVTVGTSDVTLTVVDAEG